MAFMSLAGVSCLVRQWIHGLRQSRSLCRIFLLFSAKENLDPEVVGLLSGVSANHAEWRSVHSLSSASSLFFALGIWTLRYEPLVSGSSCSLFGCTFLAQGLVRLWIHICVFFGAVLGLVVDMSVAVQRQGFGQTVEKTVGSAVAFLVVVAVPVGGSCRFSGARVEETVVSHRCSLSARVFGQGR